MGIAPSNTLTNITKDFTDDVNNTIINAYQLASNTIMAKQSLNFDCNNYDVVDYQNQCLTDTISSASERGEYFPVEDLKKICTEMFSCTAEGLKLNQAVSVNFDAEQTSKIITETSNEVKTKIQQTAKQQTGMFVYGNETKNYIENNTKILNQIISEVVQEINSSVDFKQVVNVSGYGFNLKFVEIYNYFLLLRDS